MNFDFDTGAIDGGLQTLDVSTLPPLGGTAGVLTLIGDGAITLLKGSAAQRPTAALAGMFRFNTDTTKLEYFDGIVWDILSTASGSVSSVAASSNSAALTVSGSPITSAGTLAFSLDADLTALAALASTGFAVRTATDTWAQRTVVGATGNIVVTDGDGIAGNPVVNLQSITQAATGGFVKVTLDGFGRVTGNTPVVTTDITSLVDTTYVNVAGDTMTSGANLTFTTGGEVLGLPAIPSGPTAATSKAYVDSVAEGLLIKPAVELVAAAPADLTALGAFVYNNGAAGVGATITGPVNGAFPAIDGVTLSSLVPGQNGVLVAAPGGELYNGRYNLTTVGDGSTPWVLTRCGLCDTAAEIPGAYTFVKFGSVYGGTGWVQTVIEPFTMGTGDIIVTQFSGTGAYQAGTGLSLTGNIFSIASPVATSLGGTGITTTASNGQLLVGNGSGYSLASITGGTGITVTNGAGSITIDVDAADLVTSVTGTANQISASPTVGGVILSTPTVFIAPGSVRATTTLTVDTLTPNSSLYVTTGGQLVSTAAMTDGQILIGSTGNAPVAGTITGGTGITVTNAAGAITIDVDATELVSSFSAGSTGFTPATAATGAVTLAGTLNPANGGTGLDTSTAANGQILIGNGATGLSLATITAGTGVSITNGAGSITLANTGVTGVSLNDTSTAAIYTVTPVANTTGNVAATIALKTQAANAVFAGPSTGTTAEPTFRALVLSDLSNALQLYTENASTPVAPTSTGANSVAIGSGATATAAGSFAVGSGANSRIIGQKAYANGSFATAGDAQHGVYVMRNATTDNAFTDLFLDGAAEKLVLPDNSLFVFDILVAGRRTDATGGGAGYRFVGVAKKDATSGSMTFVGTPSKTVIGETNSSWDARITSNTTDGAIRIEVRGETANSVNWVATVLSTEVTN